MKIILLILLCLFSWELAAQERLSLAEVVRVERPITPKKKLTSKKEQSVKRKHARRQKRQAKGKFKTKWKEQQTKEKKRWNVALILGVVAFAIMLFGFLLLVVIVGLTTLATIPIGGLGQILIFGLVILIIALMVPTPILAPVASIVGLRDLKDKGRPREGFDWAYFWGVFCSVVIVLLFIALAILVLAVGIGIALGATLISLPLTFIIALILIFVALLSAIMGFFISLESLRKRNDSDDTTTLDDNN